MVAVSCSVALECYFVCFDFSLMTPFSSLITFLELSSYHILLLSTFSPVETISLKI